MARGRHVRRTGLLVWLFATSVEPSQRSWRDVHAHSLVLLSDQVRTLQSELAGLSAVQEHARTSATAAERRTTRLEEQLAAAQAEIAELRGELAALREELVWVFAERRHAGPVAGAVTGAVGSSAGGRPGSAVAGGVPAVRPVARTG